MEKKWIKGDWVYDIETYPNIFTFAVIYANGKGERVFEVSDRKNETPLLLEFLRNVYNNKHRLVGFNNVAFDYQVVHYILNKSSVALRKNVPLELDSEEIYREAQRIIIEGDFGRNRGVPEKEFKIKNIDLFKVMHFDNEARSTSLKQLEFNMRSDNIEDLPYEVGRVLNDEEKDVLIKYNLHDVKETLKFYSNVIENIKFRDELNKKYPFDCSNFNDTKIGKEYFIYEIEKRKPGTCYTKLPDGRRKLNQTKRDNIALKDVVFPYVKFDRPEFQAVVKWLRSQTITETKGVFTDIEEHLLGDVAKYANMRSKRVLFKNPLVVKKDKPQNEFDMDDEEHVKEYEKQKQEFLKEHPCGVIEEKKKTKKLNKYAFSGVYRIAESLNVVVEGLEYIYGTGGIHACVLPSKWESDEDCVILDADVTSMYPSIAIANNIYPEHLGTYFPKIYKDVFMMRKQYKKGTPENAMLKLALNGVYGDSNNKYSPFYDPKYTMAVTVNGQLSLCMLAEKLLTIEGCKIIQLNTDGVTILLPKNKREEYDKHCEEWQNRTKLELEYAEYKSMYVRDVNNYIAVNADGGKVKRKGAYEYQKEWHQDQSALVVPKAAEHEILGLGKAEDFIRSHQDKYDFMLRCRVPKSMKLMTVESSLEGDENETEQQRTVRYYVSNNGHKLIKIMPPTATSDGVRRQEIEKNRLVRVCNDINLFRWDIDYDYYIERANKLINCILSNEENDLQQD